MAKVLLVQPHNDRRKQKNMTKPPLPLTLIYIGTAIEDEHEIKIYDRDLNLNDSDFFNFLEKYNPDIIGFTFMTSEMILDFMYLAKLIKKGCPDKIIVAGGVHPTVEPESVLNEPYVDYIIRGEGDEAFLEFCDTFDKNPNKLKTLKNINLNPVRPFVDINKLKLPNYSLVNIDDYGDIYVNLSRGCNGTCTFCYNTKMWGVNNVGCVRAYNLKRSIALFRMLIEDYNVKIFHIVDDNFLAFKSRAIAICKFLKKCKIHFFCFSRVDFIDEELLRELKNAGCHTIQFGFESGSQRILKFLGKRVTVEQNRRAIELCKKVGISCDASFMIGLPTETIGDLNETVKLIKTSKPDVINLKLYVPLPAPLFDYCISQKLLEKPKDLSGWALWTGEMMRISHNTSKIPNDVLMKTAEELWDVNLYKTKIKRFLYWLKAGEFEHIMRKATTFFKTGKRDIRIPFIGYIRSKETKKHIRLKS